MTRNQIELLKLRESHRAAIETARITEDQNKRDHSIKEQSLAETERQNRASLDEAVRHNVAIEGQQYANLTEQARHNLSSEALAAAAQSEMHRANLARESEQSRYNREVIRTQDARQAEDIRQHNLQNELGRYQAGAQYASVNLGFANLAEATRSHQAQEILEASRLDEISLHNRNVEHETNRANIVAENQRTSEIQLSHDRNQETARHNQAMETTTAVSTGVDAVTSVANSAANITRVLLR